MNQSILLAFYSFTSGNPILSAFAIFIAEWFPYLLVLAAVTYAFTRRSEGIVRSLLLTFSPAVVAGVVAVATKFFFPAMRPFAALYFTPLVLGESPLTSFPSFHSTFFAALGTTIFLRDKKIGTWFLLGALLIGLARIAVGVHWPSDILVGFLLGGLVAILAHHILLKIGKK